MKKTLALILALLMLLSLGACGQPADTPLTEQTPVVDETPEAQQPQEPSDTSAEEAPNEDGPLEIDYANATFDDVLKYGLGSRNWDGSLPLTTEDITLTIGIRSNAFVTDFETNGLTLWLEEQTGLNLAFHQFAGSYSDVTTQLSLMLQGGEAMPDIVTSETMDNALRSEFVEEGLVQNVAGYMITDAYYFSQAVELACKDDPARYEMMLDNIYHNGTSFRTGWMYGPITTSDSPLDLVNTEVVINRDWLDKLGLQVPTTTDELYEVLVAFRDKDPNGNGLKDEVPFVGTVDTRGRGIENYLLNPFIQYNLQRKVMIEDEKAYSLWDQDEYREALKFMTKLVQEGLLSELSFTITGGELSRMLNPKGSQPQTVGMACLWLASDWSEDSDAIHSYEPVPALKDATGRGGYSFFDAPVARNRWIIPWDCEEPLLAFRLLDFMCSPEAYLRQRWGERGVDWDWIQDTEFKDKAKGNGSLGGDAAYVTYNEGFRENSRWFVFNTYQDSNNWQNYIDPDARDFASCVQRMAAKNVQLQRQAGAPEDEFHIFIRTVEEDDIFQETNTELTAYVKRAKNTFLMGFNDVNSDQDWQMYLRELEALNMQEAWVELGQASFDRQNAD